MHGNHRKMLKIRTRMNYFLVSLALVSVSHGVLAQGYDPVIENFRLGQTDQLIINRGGPVDHVGDVNGDNLEDVIVGAGVGGVRVVFGPTNGFDGVFDAQQLNGARGFTISNDDVNDSLMAGIGDINGDGVDDIGVASLTGTRIVFGSSSDFGSNVDVSSLDGANGFILDTAATDIKRAGDINSDGLADFIVGNANASPNGLTGAGVSYVIFGSTAGFPASLSTSELDGTNGFAIIGISSQDRSGRYVSGAGDFNNDGFDDVLVGAPNQTTDGKAEAGAAYLVFGGDDFPAALSLADITQGNGLVFHGSDIQDLAGAAVAPIGDVNHDGIDDIAIGAPSKGPFGIPSDFPGEVYVLFGGNFSNTTTVFETDLDGNNGFVLRGIRGGVIPIEEGEAIWGDMAGADIDTAGDMNGDGIDDLLIGAPHTIINPARKGVGQVYIVYGSTSAFPSLLPLEDLDGDNGFRINGTGTTDYYAVSVAGAFDFNADNRSDIMMGASGQGETYVFYGRDTGSESVGSAPVAAAGTPSTGFPEAALIPDTDAEPLSFNERADPTGPNPLPEGTPTDPLDPATPGFTAPNALNVNEPLRPGEDVTANPDTTTAPANDTDSEGTDSEGTDTEGTGTEGTDSEGTDTGEGSGSGTGNEAEEGAGSGGTGTDVDTDTVVADVDAQTETGVGTTDAESTSDGVVRTGSGAALWLPLMLLGLVAGRRRCLEVSRRANPV